MAEAKDEKTFIAVGRRKEAVARVILTPGTGIITINGRPLADYFPTINAQSRVIEPLSTLDLLTKFDVRANVRGGGFSGQADAVRLGIARFLEHLNPGLRPQLKREGFLTRDPRVKERKKYGQKRARKKFQFSKR